MTTAPMTTKEQIEQYVESLKSYDVPETEKAVLLATMAHAGQRDKIGEPYILHPLRVMTDERMIEDRLVRGTNVNYLRSLAVLHDVVEDTPVGFSHLTELFGEDFANDIDSLTKRDGEGGMTGYCSYLERLLQDNSYAAIAVKKADVRDNNRLERVTRLPEDKQMRMRKKYEMARDILEMD